jgi:hypothetical protein
VTLHVAAQGVELDFVFLPETCFDFYITGLSEGQELKPLFGINLV